LFINRQQVQPSFRQVLRQSQHDWIISPHLASPLVQVMQTPSLVMSHLHMPMVRQQQHTIMPFIVQQQLHMPPINDEHRFCTIAVAVASLHMQVSFMPPWHFSILKVQRGTIMKLAMPVGMAPGDPMPAAPMPGMPIRVASVIVAVAMQELLSRTRPVGRPQLTEW
jgi:hypothetical protein